MFISFEREKLLNVIVYFLGEVNHCHTLKLFKLLNFLDFEHYRQTGKTVTNLDYFAFPNGPVPSSLLAEIKNPPTDLSEFISVNNIQNVVGELERREFVAKKKFDSSYYTKRELEIMARLALFFRDLKAENMSEFSHDPQMPWRKIYRKGEGNGKPIPLSLAFTSLPIVKDRPTIDARECEYYKNAVLE